MSVLEVVTPCHECGTMLPSDLALCWSCGTYFANRSKPCIECETFIQHEEWCIRYDVESWYANKNLCPKTMKEEGL